MVSIYDWLLLFYALAAVATTACAVLAVEVLRVRRELKALKKATSATQSEVEVIKKRLEALIRSSREEIEAEELVRFSEKLMPKKTDATRTGGGGPARAGEGYVVTSPYSNAQMGIDYLHGWRINHFPESAGKLISEQATTIRNRAGF